jgi:hypothetical protein
VTVFQLQSLYHFKQDNKTLILVVVVVVRGFGRSVVTNQDVLFYFIKNAFKHIYTHTYTHTHYIYIYIVCVRTHTNKYTVCEL